MMTYRNEAKIPSVEYFSLLKTVLGEEDFNELKDKRAFRDAFNYDYKEDFILNCDGSVSTEGQNWTSGAYIRQLNEIFDGSSPDYQIAELIIPSVASEQLDRTHDNIVDEYDPDDIINKLIRSEEIRPVVEKFLERKEGYFAVRKKKWYERTRSYEQKKFEEYQIVTPNHVSMPPELVRNRNLLYDIIAKIKPPVKDKLLSNKGEYGIGQRGVAGALAGYILLNWHDKAWMYRVIENDLPGYREVEFWVNAGAIVGGATAAILLPYIALKPQEAKTKIMKRFGRGRKISDEGVDFVKELVEKYDITDS